MMNVSRDRWRLTSPNFYDLRTGCQIFELRLTELVGEKGVQQLGKRLTSLDYQISEIREMY